MRQQSLTTIASFLTVFISGLIFSAEFESLKAKDSSCKKSVVLELDIDLDLEESEEETDKLNCHSLHVTQIVFFDLKYNRNFILLKKKDSPREQSQSRGPPVRI